MSTHRHSIGEIPVPDLRPPPLRWALLAGHIAAPKPVVARREHGGWRDKLVAAAVLLAFAAAGAVLGVMWPL